jgi:cyclic pyranopterin phosphate synthase
MATEMTMPSRRRSTKARLSHVDARGRVAMVDVGAKAATERVAVAAGEIRMNAAARRAIRARAVAKGDPIQTARLAGIMAAKRTAEWIPLCHPLALTHIDVSIEPTASGYRLTARAATIGRTGVEMEALVAVSAAALTIYDMLKAVDRSMVIGRVRLIEKRGGQSGTFRARASRPSRSGRRR